MIMKEKEELPNQSPETKLNKRIYFSKKWIRFIFMITIEFSFIFIILPYLMIRLNDYFKLPVIRNDYFSVLGIISLLI